MLPVQISSFNRISLQSPTYGRVTFEKEQDVFSVRQEIHLSGLEKVKEIFSAFQNYIYYLLSGKRELKYYTAYQISLNLVLHNVLIAKVREDFPTVPDIEGRLIHQEKVIDRLKKYALENIKIIERNKPISLKKIFQAQIEKERCLAILDPNNEKCVHPKSLFIKNPLLWEDIDICKAALARDGELLIHAPAHVKDNKDLVLLALTNKKVINKRLLLHVSKRLRDDDPDVVKAGIKQKYSNMEYAGEAFKNDKVFVLEILEHSPQAFKYISKTLQADEDVIFAYVSKYGRGLEDLDVKYKNNPKYVKAAVSDYPLALEHAGDQAKTDEICCIAILKHHNAFEFASPRIKSFPEIVIYAVQKNGWLLQYAHERLRGHPTVVFAAVSNKGGALQFASVECRSHLTIALKALYTNPEAIKYIHPTLKKIAEVQLFAIAKYPNLLAKLPKQFRNKEFLLQAARKTHFIYLLAYFGNFFAHDRTFMRIAIGQDPRAIKFAPKNMRRNKTFCKEAVELYNEAFYYLSEDMQQEEEIRAIVKQNNPRMFIHNKEILPITHDENYRLLPVHFPLALRAIIVDLLSCPTHFIAPNFFTCDDEGQDVEIDYMKIYWDLQVLTWLLPEKERNPYFLKRVREIAKMKILINNTETDYCSDHNLKDADSGVQKLCFDYFRQLKLLKEEEYMIECEDEDEIILDIDSPLWPFFAK